jgi:non-canonical poly(A) RNA polymerase PAPD5/7
MIRYRNALAMWPVHFLRRGGGGGGGRGGGGGGGGGGGEVNASHKHTGKEHVTALQRLYQNHRQNQEVGLL